VPGSIGFREQAEGAVAGAALAGRDGCAAFVVDADGRLREANQAAEGLLSSGLAVVLRDGRVTLADNAADGRFRRRLAALSNATKRSASILVGSASESQIFDLVPLPPVSGSGGGGPEVLPPRSMVLVTVRAVGGASGLPAARERFGLTRAEVMLCSRLLLGESLSEAADVLGIAIETARNRVKKVFRKTGTHRQGQLVAMLVSSQREQSARH
jgi:DNA-binding CsgD family transcriptional regulator